MGDRDLFYAAGDLTAESILRGGDLLIRFQVEIR